MHLALCLQIVQAFSRLVAAGDEWESAMPVVELLASALKADMQSSDAHAQVDAQPLFEHCHQRSACITSCTCDTVVTRSCMDLHHTLHDNSCSVGAGCQ